MMFKNETWEFIVFQILLRFIKAIMDYRAFPTNFINGRVYNEMESSNPS
jgi:hypothetical protein